MDKFDGHGERDCCLGVKFLMKRLFVLSFEFYKVYSASWVTYFLYNRVNRRKLFIIPDRFTNQIKIQL